MSKNTRTGLMSGRPSAARGKAKSIESLSDIRSMKGVNFDVTAEQHKGLKVHAASMGKTITELMSEYVQQLVKK